MGYHLLNVLTLVFLITCAPHANCTSTSPSTSTPRPVISGGERSTIENGLVAGTALATVLKDGNFRESLKKIGTNLAPFLSVLGPLVSIALAFIPTGDSPELVFMREKFAEVSNKLDIITSEFAEVKNAIDWSTVIISYGTYERKIRAAEVNLNRIYEVEGAERDDVKTEFMREYTNDFSNSVQKLYDVIMNNDHVLSENILQAVVQQTKNHKEKVEKFSLGLVQLLIKGIKVKVSYYGLRYNNAAHVVREWQTKMNNLKTTLQSLSNTIKGRYQRQMRTDVQDIILRHHSLSNEGLSHKIYNFVTEKYDWRHWFVTVYNDVHGHDKHSMFQCNGAKFLHQHEKNTFVASQEKTASSFNRRNADRLMTSTNREASRFPICPLAVDRSRILVDTMKRLARVGDRCTPYAMRMAIKNGCDLAVRSLASHTASQEMRKRVGCPPPENPFDSFRHLTITEWNHRMIVFG